MMNVKYTYEQLLEKIVRARIILENLPKAPHAVTCPIEDPESYAPCNCGSSAQQRPIREALDILKL